MVVVAIFRRLSQFADSSNYCSCLYTLISYILLLRTIKYQMRMMRLLNSQFDCKLLICLFCLVSLPSIISTLFAKSIYLYIYIYTFFFLRFLVFVHIQFKINIRNQARNMYSGYCILGLIACCVFLFYCIMLCLIYVCFAILFYKFEV
jgi:hypothetical protein